MRYCSGMAHHATTPPMPEDDWDLDDPEPNEPDPDEDFSEALTAAERNPSLCRR